MAATMSDVAARAGVSVKTVSNFFNGYPYMRDETRQRIEAAVAVAEHLLQDADCALYRAKRDGRECYRFFHPDMRTAAAA